jgi:hypothetical protein
MFDELKPLFSRWWKLSYNNRFHRYFPLRTDGDEGHSAVFGVGFPLIIEGRENSEYRGECKVFN